jgi:hypothetical protein
MIAAADATTITATSEATLLDARGTQRHRKPFGIGTPAD